MCLAVPARVLTIEGDEGTVDLGGITRQVSFAVTPDVKVGDYVLLHTGYAISIVDEEEARESLLLFEDLAQAGEELP